MCYYELIDHIIFFHVFWGLWIAVWIAIEDFYTLTHGYIGFSCFMGTFHRHSVFYNVLTVYYFPIH